MSDSSDDMEIFSGGWLDEEDHPLEDWERIERLEKIIIEIFPEITSGTGGKFLKLKYIIDKMKKQLQ